MRPHGGLSVADEAVHARVDRHGCDEGEREVSVTSTVGARCLDAYAPARAHDELDLA
jgi:hypothetical protein